MNTEKNYRPKTGEKYVALAERLVKEEHPVIIKKETEPDLLILPPFSLVHINRLTDDTGIIQHAKFGIPNLKEGYCLDDNGRALLMVLMAYRQMKDMRALELFTIYLSYIHYMQNADGTFRNFLSFSRNFLTKWALKIRLEEQSGRSVIYWGMLQTMLIIKRADYFFQCSSQFRKVNLHQGNCQHHDWN